KLEHDPEKWIPVFGKRSCSKKKLERDDDSKKSHHALNAGCPGCATRSSGLQLRLPFVDALKGLAHQLGAIALGEAIGDAERVDAFFIRQQLRGAGPVGAPQAALEAEAIEDATQRLPNVFVRERLVRKRAGAGDLDDDVGVGGELEQLRQFGKRL